jgi:hypothetical protein
MNLRFIRAILKVPPGAGPVDPTKPKRPKSPPFTLNSNDVALHHGSKTAVVTVTFAVAVAAIIICHYLCCGSTTAEYY